MLGLSAALFGQETKSGTISRVLRLPSHVGIGGILSFIRLPLFSFSLLFLLLLFLFSPCFCCFRLRVFFFLFLLPLSFILFSFFSLPFLSSLLPFSFLFLSFLLSFFFAFPFLCSRFLSFFRLG